jgi:hypothetical protein
MPAPSWGVFSWFATGWRAGCMKVSQCARRFQADEP